MVRYRLEITEDYEQVYAFLVGQKFPCERWTIETLAGYCVVLTIIRDETQIGFVWLIRDYADGVEAHVCVLTEHRGRWLTNRIRDDVFAISRLVGAKHLVVVPDGDDRHRDRVCNWALRRLGGVKTDCRVSVDLKRGK